MKLARALAALCVAHICFASPETPGKLAVGVGQMAPRLEVGRWIKGKPRPLFDKGMIYIIESWATWCIPCVQSIPHLTELQKKYKERIRVIGIDIWEQDGARALVEGKKAFAMAAVVRVLFAKGEKEKALELQRRALDKAVGSDEKEEMRTLLDFMLGKK
jgi:thiol-disulfide isomerase/thioredoxin